MVHPQVEFEEGLQKRLAHIVNKQNEKAPQYLFKQDHASKQTTLNIAAGT